MAIIRNVVMRGASKRLGGVVFYTRAGETVARELAPSVSNPRTEVQMTQRIKLANVVAAYKANKSWMAGAFEDKAEKESDYNAFVRMNLSNSLVALNKSQASAGACIVAPYQVSSGSLPQIDCTGQTTGVRSNLYCGTLIITEATTVAQISAALISNNNGIIRGMQLSLIVNIQRADGNLVRPYIVARSYEFIIDETNSELLSKYVPFGLLQTLESESRPLFFNGETLGSGAATFILSQTISGRLYVSSQILRQFGDQSLYGFYTSEPAIKAAIASYGENSERFLDSDSAREFNPVTLENFIMAMQLGSQYYSNGARVTTNLASSENFFLYISQPLTQAQTTHAVVSFRKGADMEPVTPLTLDWNVEHNRVRVNMPAGITIDEETECEFEISYDDVDMFFNFTAVPRI